jgi:hypothetical protein
MQFIRAKVDILYAPDDMDGAYILFDGARFPITRTDKVANGKAKRANAFPSIDYSRKGASHV